MDSFDKNLWKEIDRILWEEWDPIGVNDIAPSDEYSSYVPQIYKLLSENADLETISNQLYEFAIKNMGIYGTREHCKYVADLLVRLKNK